MYIYINMYMYAHMCMYACPYIYTYPCTCIHVNIYIYMYIPTYKDIFACMLRCDDIEGKSRSTTGCMPTQFEHSCSLFVRLGIKTIIKIDQRIVAFLRYPNSNISSCVGQSFKGEHVVRRTRG